MPGPDRFDGPAEPDGLVQVDPASDGTFVVVRSSGSELLFTRVEWEAFLRGVKDGEFDLPTAGVGSGSGCGAAAPHPHKLNASPGSPPTPRP